MSLQSVHPLVEPCISSTESGANLGKSLRGLLDERILQLSQQSDVSSLLSKLFTNGLDLLQTELRDHVTGRAKVAGVYLLDAVMAVNDESNASRRVDVSNNIRKLVFENERLNLEYSEPIVRAAALLIGHFARISSATEIEFLQRTYLDLFFRLIVSMRADHLRFSGAVISIQLSINSPSLVFARRREVLARLWETVSDKNSIVRLASAEALEIVLQLVSQREDVSEHLTNAIKIAVSGLTNGQLDNSKVVGALLILSILISGKIIKLDLLKQAIQKSGMLIEDFIWHVLQLFGKKLELEARNLVIDLVPKLTSAFSKYFVTSNKYLPQNGTFLQYSVRQLLAIVKSKRDAASSFTSLGQLFNCCSAIRTSSLVEEIFGSVIDGFNDPSSNAKALECMGMIVHTSLPSRRLIDKNVIDAMFRGGLSNELSETLQIIIRYVPKVTRHLQIVLRTEINNILLRYAVVVDDSSDRTAISASGRVQSANLGSNIMRPLAKDVANGYLVGNYMPPSAAKPAAPVKSGGWFFHSSSAETTSASEKAPQVSNVNSNNQILLALNMVAACADFFDIDPISSENSRDAKSLVLGVGPEGETSSYAGLLNIVKDGVARYLDDSNETIRCAAALTCLSLFDHLATKIDNRSPDYSVMLKVVERLLLMTVGDNSTEIRCKILSAFPPGLDSVLAVSQYTSCLTEALNDESLSIRVGAMTVLSRVAHFDVMRVMPVVRLSITNLVKQLHYSRYQMRRESVQLLEALVRGANTLVVPYVNQILDPLMKLLEDSPSENIGIVLSTIGELAVASPESIMPYIEKLFPRLIEALGSETVLSTREIAVMAMGKLVASLTLLTDMPYAKFPTLFGGLVSSIQCEDDEANDLRLQAIRTMGLLGAVEQSVHQSRLRKNVTDVDAFLYDYSDEQDQVVSGSMSETAPRINANADRPSALLNEPEKELKKSEKFNFSIVLRELTRMILDNSLVIHHQMALQTAIKAIRLVGSRGFPLIDGFVKALFVRFGSPDTSISMRDQILDSLANLVYIIGKPIRVYQAAFVEIISENMSSHLQNCLDLIEATFVIFSSGHFQTFLSDVIPTIVSLCREEAMEVTRNATDQAMQANARSNTSSVSSKGKYDLPVCGKVLQTIANIKSKLGHFRKQLIHMVMSVLDNMYVSQEIRRFALCVSIHLADDDDLLEYANRIVHPIIRMISTCNSSEISLLQAAVISLSAILCRVGIDFLPFILPIRRCFRMQSKDFQRLPQVEEFDSLVFKLLQLRPLPATPSDMFEIAIHETTQSKVPKGTSDLPFQMSYQALETAWALADRDSQSDLIDWIERLSIELIRQCPSPVIRMCAPLTKAYKPLAEKLFNVSFCCIWDELYIGESNDVIDDIPIINSIEMALKSSQIPMNIVNVLLTLAEYMGMQDKRLPLDVPLLGRQAEAANMFSKSLYYRELEFESRNITPTSECVDALITVSNELGLHERAKGVLSYVVHYMPNMEIKPLWLEKLQQWHEANGLYKSQNQLLRELYPTDKPSRHPVWMSSELGVMRCLHSLGEYAELQRNALEMKDSLKSSDVSESQQATWLQEIQTLGAHASWMLGQWGAMGQFVEGDIATPTSTTNDVELKHNLNFYRAVLAIHDKKFDSASQLITTTRTQISQAISALMSENYSRAYRAMVSMQVLSEMEEVVEFKQSLERSKIELEMTSPKMRSSIAPSLRAPIHSNSFVDLFSAGNSQLVPAAGSNNSFTAVASAARAALVRKWNGRLRSAPKEVDMYRQILAVHSLAVEPSEDLDGWLELVSLCRQEGRFTLCGNLLRRLGAPELPTMTTDYSWTSSSPMSTATLQVHFATFTYWWMRGDRTIAADALGELLDNFPDDKPLGHLGSLAANSTVASLNQSFSNNKSTSFDLTTFRVHCLLKKADWIRELGNRPMSEALMNIREARDLAPDDYIVWHSWAVANYNQLQKADSNTNEPMHASSRHAGVFDAHSKPSMLNQMRSSGDRSAGQLPPLPMTSPAPQHGKTMKGVSASKSPVTKGVRRSSVSLANLMTYKQETDTVSSYIVEAIKGFVRSIVLGRNQPIAMVLQDTLRLLTLWFTYGTKSQVFQILSTELAQVSSENWLMVVPQLIARMHVKSNEISGLLQRLLIKLASAHPQALVCPIYVALNTADSQQKEMATEVVREMRKQHCRLVDEAILVSRELLQVAITPHEEWHDGLELAAQQYMEAKDTNAMVQTLMGLHDKLNNESAAVSDTASMDSFATSNFSNVMADVTRSTEWTLREVSFKHSYGRQLADAQSWLAKFRDSGQTTHLHQAWEVYQVVFKRIKVQIANLKKVELHHVSPALTGAVNLTLAVPGTYSPFAQTISIAKFSPSVTVIASKQRPRRMVIVGSDGKEYKFLLKGHEDLRQDERVMQLFGLINVCFDNSQTTRNRGLEIVRYSVLPLSNNSGVIGWVDNCDTLNSLVKQYREMKQIRLTLETKLLANKSQNYNKLTLMQKVEAFTQVLDETTGQDLSKMMWLKSRTADAWVERRAYFTKSLAVMSMVGYILGLGDRHPSNLMVDRISGRIVHIDFGDCFEVTAKRPKFPEIIPFRLTRMLQTAVGRSGIEGTFRVACERVMNVLRDNKDSVMAMLEAFVFDPLISWKLLGQGKEDDPTLSEGMDPSPINKVMESIQEDATSIVSSDMDELEKDDDFILSPSNAGEGLTRRDSLGGEDEGLNEDINSRALEVITRIQAKLTGRDFAKVDTDPDLTVEKQVDRLIKEATNVENLCQLYQGWCPLW